MSSVLEAAKRNLALREAQPKRPAHAPSPDVDVTDLSPYQAAKKIAAAKDTLAE